MVLLVALATQVVWIVVRYAGESMFGRSGYLIGLEFGVWLASMLVAALAMFELASRQSSPHKGGALIAAGAFLASAGCVIGMDLAQRAGWFGWMTWMNSYGWRALDTVAIAGLAIAGGRRTTWFAAPAIGLALIGHPSSSSPQLWYAVICGLRLVLVFVLLQEAERFATQEASYPRLERGFRILEIGVWLSIGLTLCRLIPGVDLPTSPVVAFVANVVRIATYLVISSGAWLVVRSRMAEVPRWPFAISLVAQLWMAARLGRSWTVTLATKWDRFETVKLTHVPWWVYIPLTIATLCTAASLLVLARRLQVSTRVQRVAMVLVVASAALTPIRLSPLWIWTVVSVVTSLAMSFSLRSTRADLHLVHERAMHAHTFA